MVVANPIFFFFIKSVSFACSTLQLRQSTSRSEPTHSEKVIEKLKLKGFLWTDYKWPSDYLIWIICFVWPLTNFKRFIQSRFDSDYYHYFMSIFRMNDKSIWDLSPNQDGFPSLKTEDQMQIVTAYLMHKGKSSLPSDEIRIARLASIYW